MRIPPRVRDIELPQFDRLNDIAAKWRARGADVITLGQALPGFEPPREAIDALRQALDDGASHVYSADAGMPELRRALAGSLARLGASVDPDNEIIITAGANQAFQLALTTLIDPGDEVILPSPFFLNHEMAVRSVAAIPVEAPTAGSRSFIPSWEDISAHLSPRTAAVVIVSPSNPTGAVVAPEELQRIVIECAARGVVVFVDETYLHFTYEAAPAAAAALARWRDNVVVVGSFSKAFAITGWRCGYLIASAAVIVEAMKIQDCMIICAPVPVQRAVTVILERHPDYPRRWLPELRARRTALVEALRAIPGVSPVTPAGGFFVMTRVDGMTDSRAAALDLADSAHVVTIPGRFFGRAGEGYLRLSYGAATQERLRVACGRIAHFLVRSRRTDSSDTVQVS
jgi:aspartate/methionine/tyrosine aminotransferase